MKLQYSAMNSMGLTWIDAQDRFDEFVDMAAAYHGHTRDQIINNGLLAGKKIKIEAGWDATNIRDFNSIPQPAIAAATKICSCKKCGQTGADGSYPFSTLVGSGICDDCL